MTFTDAAFERLASCAGLQVSVSDGDLALQPLDSPSRVRLWRINPPLELASEDRTQNEANAKVLAFVSFSGLIELAARAGYVDVWEWYATFPLTKAAELICKHLGARLEEPPFSCVRALMARLSLNSPTEGPPSPDAFTPFESYLALTRSLGSDEGVFRSLHETHTVWKPGFDRGALITPRHLAEAIATARVGAVPMDGIPGIPRTLQAYDWLVSIVTRLGEQDDLCKGILVHANWSHAAWVFRHRTEEWATAMSEWSIRRDSEGEREWRQFRERVFEMLETAQAELGLERTTNVNSLAGRRTITSVAPDPKEDLFAAENHVEELVVAGRHGAARRYLQDVLIHSSTLMSYYFAKAERSEQLNDRLVGRFLRLANRLADLGDVDSAAAFVLRHMNGIAEVGYGVAARAVVLRAGTGATIQIEEALLERGAEKMSQLPPVEGQARAGEEVQTARPNETVRSAETLRRRESS